MSLANFSLPYHSATPTPFLYNGAHAAASNLRLNAVVPPGRPVFDDRPPFQNEPYIPPPRYQQEQRQQQQQTVQQINQNVYVEHSSFSSQSSHSQDSRYVDYGQDFRRTQSRQQQQQQQQQQHEPTSPLQQMRPPPPPSADQQRDHDARRNKNDATKPSDREGYPGGPNGYTRVNGEGYGAPGTKTSVHAVLDYDDDFDDYYDEEDADVPRDANVTPIQGPIFLKNGSFPVVPLYSYPQLNNGTFVQIPILWTALSVALGVELRGDLVRGTPCIKRYHQLFCPTAGNTYPIERIEQFIDENKALMKRMYGAFEVSPESNPRSRGRRKRRAQEHDLPDGGPRYLNEKLSAEPVASGDTYFGRDDRPRRQSFGKTRTSDTGRVDACESKVEIVTPYWASNSAGKIRAIVNTQHFEQAIHQEVCSKTQTNRCSGDCGCEQKYKWHRLLAYDPDNDCKGIFMDWFLFPSCCVCRCDPAHDNNNANKFPPAGASQPARN